MKFLTKINRNYFLLLTLLLFLISVGGYFILKTVIYNQTKESLLEKAFLIKKQIYKTGTIPTIYPLIEVIETVEKQTNETKFREVFIKEEGEDEMESYLEFSDIIEVGDAFYLLKIRQPNVEGEDLIMAIAFPLLILLASAFGISTVVSKKMNQTIWADFENNLLELENFTFESQKGLLLKNTGIQEFDRLNEVAERLTEKLKQDFILLKEFTENASHEIQTPLSIVLLNLEEILQQELPETTFKKVISSINAIKRLSKLNQSLILLAKIENQQFVSDENLNLTLLFQNKLTEFEPLITLRTIKVDSKIQHDFYLKINRHLADILVNNLLSNAINHNIVSGIIKIESSDKKITVINSGQPAYLAADKIFDRFVKTNSTSFGLGLSLVKIICATNNLEIQYHFDGFHHFVISKKDLTV